MRIYRKRPEGERPSKILIVEDDIDTRALLHDWVVRLGHQADACADGEEALAALADECYDALLVDVLLPGIDGYELIRRVRQEGLSDAPVAITSITERRIPEDVAVQAWLGKPFSRRDLTATLAALAAA